MGANNFAVLFAEADLVHTGSFDKPLYLLIITFLQFLVGCSSFRVLSFGSY
jgi:hypothetical protein